MDKNQISDIYFKYRDNFLSLIGHLQNQSSSYQTQLGKRKDMLTSTEQNLRSQITQLEEQLGLKPDRFILEAGSLAAIARSISSTLGSPMV